jgi:hypothetical protein
MPSPLTHATRAGLSCKLIQRTHIWSSSVLYIGWKVTLPTRFETNVMLRPLEYGTAARG